MNTDNKSNTAASHPRTSAYIRGSFPAYDLTNAEKRYLSINFRCSCQYEPRMNADEHR